MPATRFKRRLNRRLFGKKGARQYEAIRRKGADRQTAARIVNAQKRRKRGR